MSVCGFASKGAAVPKEKCKKLHYCAHCNSIDLVIDVADQCCKLCVSFWVSGGLVSAVSSESFTHHC